MGQRRVDYLVGMDEVGRGAWAGPVVVGAVMLGGTIAGLRDSKQLTRLQRETLDEKIRKRALAIALGWADSREIDELGLTNALKLAFGRALAGIEVAATRIIIDGGYNFLPGDVRAETLIDADALVPAVSAASIVAKVARDAFMAKASRDFPEYAFERHVGYGTAAHRDALLAHGACSLHRRSFQPVRRVIAQDL